MKVTPNISSSVTLSFVAISSLTPWPISKLPSPVRFLNMFCRLARSRRPRVYNVVSVIAPLGLKTTSSSFFSVGHFPATTSYCSSKSETLPGKTLKLSIPKSPSPDNISSIPRLPKPKSESMVSGLTCLTPTISSCKYICGVIPYLYSMLLR